MAVCFPISLWMELLPCVVHLLSMCMILWILVRKASGLNVVQLDMPEMTMKRNAYISFNLSSEKDCGEFVEDEWHLFIRNDNPVFQLSPVPQMEVRSLVVLVAMLERSMEGFFFFVASVTAV